MQANEMRIGQNVRVSGNTGAWETGRIKLILPGDKAFIGYGSPKTPDFLLRYGTETPRHADELELI
jgi:hypothetical protein